MDESAARALLAEQAEVLRDLARRMAEHGVGQRWEGPARRACEAQLIGLEEDLRTEARRLDTVAQWGGVLSVKAHLG